MKHKCSGREHQKRSSLKQLCSFVAFYPSVVSLFFVACYIFFFLFSFEICVKKIVAALFVSLRMHPLLFVFLLSFRVVINFTSKYLSRQYCFSRQIVTFLISAGDRAEEEVAHEKDCLDHPLVDGDDADVIFMYM